VTPVVFSLSNSAISACSTSCTVLPGWTMATAKNRLGSSVMLPLPNALSASRLL
jgi:hypothetical protein